MARFVKRVLGMWTVLVLIGGSALGCLIISLFFVPNIYGVLASSSLIAVSLYWYYVRYVKKKKPRYPLTAPEGKSDFYLPRTNIPRPVHADFREIDEKRRRLAKIRRLARKKTLKKKK